jgi:hypothetical protein
MSAEDDDIRIDLDQARAKLESGDAVALDVVQPSSWDQLDGEIRQDGERERNAEVERSGVRIPLARACLPTAGLLRPGRPEPRRRDDLGHFDLPSAGSPVCPQSLAFATRNDEIRVDRPGFGPD